MAPRFCTSAANAGHSGGERLATPGLGQRHVQMTAQRVSGQQTRSLLRLHYTAVTNRINYLAASVAKHPQDLHHDSPILSDIEHHTRLYIQLFGWPNPNGSTALVGCRRRCHSQLILGLQRTVPNRTTTCHPDLPGRSSLVQQSKPMDDERQCRLDRKSRKPPGRHGIARHGFTKPVRRRPVCR